MSALRGILSALLFAALVVATVACTAWLRLRAPDETATRMVLDHAWMWVLYGATVAAGLWALLERGGRE